MRSRRFALLVALALLAGTMLATKLPSASAGIEVCPCVVLIEVDGLEPKDVTPEATPFLWELAHPQGGQIVGAGRSGFTWQAPRANMAATTAANAASLLTGGYAEQTGIPGDEFQADGGTIRMERQPQDGSKPLDFGDVFAESLLDLVPSGSDDKKAVSAFVGNPALGGLIGASVGNDPLRWAPTNDDPQNPPNPAYCDVPRRLPGGESAPEEGFEPSCSATDMVTLNKAITALNSSAPDAQKVAFTYIHLAELGVVKRSGGDVATPGEPGTGEAGDEVPQALAQLDAALATFVTRYKDQTRSAVTGPKWTDTYIMVTGNHGYEPTPQANRVPGGDDESLDLEHYVEKADRLEYAPNGGIATIYATEPDPARRRDALEEMRSKLSNSGPVEEACEALGASPADDLESEGGGCIKEILYVRDGLLPAGTTAADRRKLLLSEAHPSWRLDHIEIADDDTSAPTGISGDMVIVTEPGWTTGRAVPDPALEADPEDQGPLPVNDSPNPYTGSAGGPRNRAVAALINGPSGGNGARQVTGGRYPVRNGSDDPEEVPFSDTPEPAFDSLHAANANPGDDADAVGHERQPETVDFAPTIGALLQVAVPDEQLAGRFLQEAFLRQLSFPSFEEDLGDPIPEPEPPPEPEPVIIYEPPPPVPVVEQPKPCPGFTYTGVLRDFKAAVGDKKGNWVPDARRRAKLSYLVLKGDFGRPNALVKLTFYSDKLSAARNAGKAERKKAGRNKAKRRKARRREARRLARRRARGKEVVESLVTFDPFAVKRGPATLTLEVPKVFKPTHIGIVVQEARKLTRREYRALKKEAEEPDKVLRYEGAGKLVGGIFPLKYAKRLHKRAPKPSRKRLAKRRQRQRQVERPECEPKKAADKKSGKKKAGRKKAGRQQSRSRQRRS